MRKKWLIMILLVLVLAIMLVLRLKGTKDKEDDSTNNADGQTEQTDANSAADTNSVTDEALGSLAGNENGGVDITVTAEDGTAKTYTFTDVALDAWYAQAVDYVVSTGVMSGDEEQSLFRPEYGVERSQFAVIMYRFAGGTPTAEEASFSDLTGDEWYYEYVKWMVGEGLMGGNGGAFDPNGFLSCEQALIVLYRLAGEPAITGTLEGYPYAPKVSESGKDAVTWAWNSGLITETECVWYPTQAVSRAQVALLLMRYDTLIGRNAA